MYTYAHSLELCCCKFASYLLTSRYCSLIHNAIFFLFNRHWIYSKLSVKQKAIKSVAWTAQLLPQKDNRLWITSTPHIPKKVRLFVKRLEDEHGQIPSCKFKSNKKCFSNFRFPFNFTYCVMNDWGQHIVS